VQRFVYENARQPLSLMRLGGMYGMQDWPAWMREGIIDLASPMLYKREHAAAERKQFDDWLQFVIATAHTNGRAAVPGSSSDV